MIDIKQVLSNPNAYDEKVNNVSIIQTHISWIFLTGNFVYKIKKPVNFGFLDFSTLKRRKFFCEREFEINSEFSPDVYIAVLPVTDNGGHVSINGKGDVIDYCIKMRQIPQESLMSHLLDENSIHYNDIENIANVLIKYYSVAKKDSDVIKNATYKITKFNWDENFKQTEDFVNWTINKDDFDFIKNKIKKFLKINKKLLNDRISRGMVRWCHGDLHSGNIFIQDDKALIFDGIEFNKRFACSDIASDIAFLAMDLEHKGHNHLSHHLINYFIKISNDCQLNEVIDFYKCYRAYVRGKVISFKLNDPGVDEEEKKKAIDEAHSYFVFARQYAKRL